MFRLILAVVLAAGVQFAWGFTYWMVTPLGKEMIGQLPDDEKVMSVLREANPQTGVYFLPYGDCQELSKDPEAMEAFAARRKAGPLVQVIYNTEGTDMMAPTTMAMGYAHLAGSCLLAAALLFLAAPALKHYFGRVLFVTLLGVFAVFAINFANPIWFHSPWKFTLYQSFFDVVSWVLGAIVLAAFIRRAE